MTITVMIDSEWTRNLKVQPHRATASAELGGGPPNLSLPSRHRLGPARPPGGDTDSVSRRAAAGCRGSGPAYYRHDWLAPDSTSRSPQTARRITGRPPESDCIGRSPSQTWAPAVTRRFPLIERPAQRPVLRASITAQPVPIMMPLMGSGAP